MSTLSAPPSSTLPKQRRVLGRSLLAVLAHVSLGLCSLYAYTVSSVAANHDPLDSPRWLDMQKQFFLTSDKKIAAPPPSSTSTKTSKTTKATNELAAHKPASKAAAQVVFDPRVKVIAPEIGENPLNVPITVDASALSNATGEGGKLSQITEVLIFADFNPITEIARFYPDAAPAYLGLRVKLQQSTPVRAAARTADGVWHVGGTWVNTAGGGCTVPSTGSASPDWLRRLNEVSSRRWQSAPDGPSGQRLRLRIIHPMDTGLSAGVPAFHLTELSIKDSAGKVLMRIEPREPVSENPLFTLNLPPDLGSLHISGRDNNGNTLAQTLEAVE